MQWELARADIEVTSKWNWYKLRNWGDSRVNSNWTEWNRREIEVTSKWCQGEIGLTSEWQLNGIEEDVKWNRRTSKWNRIGLELHVESSWSWVEIEVISEWNLVDLEMALRWSRRAEVERKWNRSDIAVSLKCSQIETTSYCRPQSYRRVFVFSEKFLRGEKVEMKRMREHRSRNCVVNCSIKGFRV